MAFIKKEKKASGTYLRVVHGYRDTDGKIKHKTLINLGKAEDYTKQSLQNMGKLLYELGGGDIEELENLSTKELGRYYYGFTLVVQRLLGEYGLDNFFDRIGRNKDLNYSLTQSVLLMISERLHGPVSKHASYHNQAEYLGIGHLELQYIYRSLDHLCANQEIIQRMIFEKGRNLFNQSLDVVFYDVTTFYFESEKEDGFREKGFNKDGKIGKSTVMFGMLIDKHKNPVGYEVYHGKQYEGYTFSDVIEKLQGKYNIEKIITVADRGMMNKDNISEITSKTNYEYIIGERLKNLSNAAKDEILDKTKYKKLQVTDQETMKKVTIEYYIHEYNGKSIITTYSENRAKHDRYLREERVKKAKKLLENPSEIDKKARYHYIEKTGKNTYHLNEEKIKETEKYDGFLSIATNVTGLSTTQVLDAYKDLYKIEHTFRSLKSFLETRPMFHWTENRIMGHICLCYITYTLLNCLQQKLKQAGKAMSENMIRKNLISMQVSLIRNQGHEYYLRSSTKPGASDIMELLKIRELPNLVPREVINNYLKCVDKSAM
jgi:transposase